MMNGNNDNIVTLTDLRSLEKQGGATARLENGDEVDLKPSYGIIQNKKAFVGGTIGTVGLVEDYSKIINRIRTIKRNGILIARRTKQDVLQLTGKGYHKR